MKISRLFATLPLVDIGLRPHRLLDDLNAGRRSQLPENSVTLILDRDETGLPDIEFIPDPPEKYFFDVTSMDSSIKMIPSLFTDETVITPLLEQFPSLTTVRPDIENLRSAVLDLLPTIYKNLKQIYEEIRKAVQESQSEYALIMLYHEMQDESKSESELKEMLKFFRWISCYLIISN